MDFIVQVSGSWFTWNPPVGLVDSIGVRASWTAAAAYAHAVQRGESEADAQQKAEKVAYQTVYRVKY